MSVSFALGLLSCILVLSALSSYRKERRARGWPVTTASVVETEPQTPFERAGRVYVPNKDSDHFLEWSVDGQSYRIKLPDDAHFVLMGIKRWRRTPSADATVLHYNPANPLEHMRATDFGAWKSHLIMGMVACIGAIIAGLA